MIFCIAAEELLQAQDIGRTVPRRKRTVFYVVDFAPLRHFWLVMAVQLQLTSVEAEDLLSWT